MCNYLTFKISMKNVILKNLKLEARFLVLAGTNSV